ncbi:MAG: acireductone synthase [Alphaproteobacteria bacterium]|nr:acireductone synthase [Alphaproteobacteria bacterium]MDX5415557.1 acireductone synthase [Alphaproteobacteria bacterium]MDX5492797.1 acireductone synthase [Alphaproteobacteria bacterium]
MSDIRAVVTDIEGTAAPLAFVHEVLFPYARARLAAFLDERESDPDVARALREARELGAMPNADLPRTIALLHSWMDEDRKAGPLKFLQGLIWRQGYEEGVLKGEVYEDAAVRLRQWRERGLRLFVYSSGSEDAQKLIFGYSDKGDLASLFDGFFDTRVGAKVESASYRAIAESASLPADAMLFLSDHPGEIAAAREAGMQVVRIDRALPPGQFMDDGASPVAGSFDPVEVLLPARK